MFLSAQQQRLADFARLLLTMCYPAGQRQHISVQYGEVRRMCWGCRYCASHQEMRESVVRGLDGPGMSPLDIFPRAWQHLPGLQSELEHRQRKLARLQVPLHSHCLAMMVCGHCDHIGHEQKSMCFPGVHHAGPHV